MKCPHCNLIIDEVEVCRFAVFNGILKGNKIASHSVEKAELGGVYVVLCSFCGENIEDEVDWNIDDLPQEIEFKE